MRKVIRFIIAMFNPQHSEAYQELLIENAKLALELAYLRVRYDDLMLGKNTSRKLAGMNYKQIEEMKNFYVSNIGSLPNA